VKPLKTLSLYQPGRSIIHKIDPVTKLLFIILAIFVPIIIGTWGAALLTLLISLSFILIGRVFKKVLPILGFSSIIILSVIIIQGLFYVNNKAPLFTLGPVTVYREGFYYALNIALRIYNILVAVSILVLTTKPSDLIEALVRKGFSPRIGYIFSSVLQIIPQMMSTVDTISDAQRSRGLETEGRLSARIKAFFPLIGPVVMNSLISTRERAMALEVRAFNSKRKKTFLHEEVKTGYSRFLQFILLAILLAAIVWRVLS
jgi:energy-coupling factor transport system permease protein